MLLKTLSATNFGPFMGDTIFFEPGVTVITGANDTGKSSLLRLLKIICSKTGSSEMTELDVNLDRATDLAAGWNEDKRVTASAVFHLPNQPGSSAEVKYFLAPEVWKNSELKTKNFNGALHNRYDVLPKAVLVDLSKGPQIREKIPLDAANAEEKNLMAVAFDPGFNHNALTGLSDIRYNIAISDAEEKLNTRLNQILPPTLGFRFRLKSYSDKRQLIFLGLQDNHGGLTELTRRGKGIQTLVTLLGHLAAENYSAPETLLLLDEPETHLHADAQHSLRRTLELLAETGRFQIVYATHSPCMVNTMRPQSIRLLTRAKQEDIAVTKVDNTPFKAGFASVRSSLGISPADSLLFAPITIIAEGKTEVLCLPILLKRLSDVSNPGFENASTLLAQTVLIDAEGCGNIGHLCRLARSHGASVLVYADGDQSKRWEQQIKRDAEGTPIIVSKVGGEFEQIVSPERYFDALAQHYNGENVSIAYEDYLSWQAQANLPLKLAFTKRIERWFTDVLDKRAPQKAEVMRIAVEITPLEEIERNGLSELLAAMHASIAKT